MKTNETSQIRHLPVGNKAVSWRQYGRPPWIPVAGAYYLLAAALELVCLGPRFIARTSRACTFDPLSWLDRQDVAIVFFLWLSILVAVVFVRAGICCLFQWQRVVRWVSWAVAFCVLRLGCLLYVWVITAPGRWPGPPWTESQPWVFLQSTVACICVSCITVLAVRDRQRLISSCLRCGYDLRGSPGPN